MKSTTQALKREQAFNDSYSLTAKIKSFNNSLGFYGDIHTIRTHHFCIREFGYDLHWLHASLLL